MKGIDDNLFFITGGAQGIGFVVAEAIGAAGGAVALADLSEEATQAAAARLAATGTRAAGHALDVRDVAAIRALVRHIENTVGTIDGAVSCAGITRTQPAETMEERAWRDVMEVNVSGTFFTCQAVAGVMLARGCGAIVNIVSITSFGGQAGRSNCAASRWAVSDLTRTLAIEWGSGGIRINAVGPNAVDTPMLRQGVPDGFVDDVMLDRTPLGRVARAEEIASVIVFLLSD